MNIHDIIEPLVVQAIGERPTHPDFINLMSTYEDMVAQASSGPPETSMQNMVWAKTGIPAEMVRLYSMEMATQSGNASESDDPVVVLVSNFCMAVGSGRHMKRGKDMTILIKENMGTEGAVERLTFAGIDMESVKWLATFSALKTMVSDPFGDKHSQIATQWITGIVCGWNYDSLRSVNEILGDA